MNSTTHKELPPDQPLADATPYGYGPNDSVSDANEEAAITQHTLNINGKSLSYTATAGHLVTTGSYTATPAAKLFYVAFTATDPNPSGRPITFFYNGGPGSSSVFLLLGSFGPRRIRTSMPDFTPPAPYTLEDNPETLLDESDLVFIDPVGTGYSTAIAPKVNKDFWGVDQDASCIKQFIKRYLTVFNRWNSPKYLFGESYGTPRTCVLTWMLHEDGVDLNGIVLQSSILDYSQASPVGVLPTFAADAWFHKKVSVTPAPADLPSFMEEVMAFAMKDYAKALDSFPKVPQNVLQHLSEILGIPPMVLKYWQLDPTTGNGPVFLTSLLLEDGLAVGSYDGRVTGDDTGIAEYISPDAGGNDPTMTAVGGVYTTMWNVYLNEELKYTSISPFMDLNDKAFKHWDFGHIDPTGSQRGGIGSLYTAGDLAAAMSVNPYLRVFSANGYYDSVTPFFQTILNFQSMPLGNAQALNNLTIRNYPSGHMIYLDNESRTAMRADLASFYQASESHAAAMKAALAKGPSSQTGSVRYHRRASRTPY
ncbi:peptidase S1 (plasmid) [Paraburkholderia sp. PGU19]|uniref:S10 family peptidase n=1 Tax=Paraburkholderia sp. PGU19 TaxID=2735434 RepID=UPI0015DB7729|nr:peptidase S1 [Paraburkholderia sp. PGU19]BCG01650.1 peptidase S1 [Paraburkholderia sp. PGU19]